jgi:hypothetical protein
MITVINTHLPDYYNFYTTLTISPSATSLYITLTGKLQHSLSSYYSAAGLASRGLIMAKRLWDVALLFSTRLCPLLGATDISASMVNVKIIVLKKKFLKCSNAAVRKVTCIRYEYVRTRVIVFVVVMEIYSAEKF